jgi:hypothetical protein
MYMPAFQAKKLVKGVSDELLADYAFELATALGIRVALLPRRRAFSQEEAWVKSSS